MNKAIQKMMMALAVCGALCGTAMATPKGSTLPRGKAPTAMKAPVQKPQAAKAAAPVRQKVKMSAPVRQTAHATKAPGRAPAVAHATPARPAPRHEVARPAPPPPAPHHEPRHHAHHHSTTLHTEDWCGIGASLLGGLIGGLIGSSI